MPRCDAADEQPRGYTPVSDTGEKERPERDVNRAEFEAHVRAALDELPPDVGEKLKNVAVVVEDEHPEDPDLFGLFEEQPYMPARVSVYRVPLVEEFGDSPGLLEEEIRITVLHELAHYFGIDEDRLAELGYD